MPTERNRLLADVRPLSESPEYRRLWVGQSLSSVGNQMTNVAVPVQVYAMTHSSLAVGSIGLAVGVPFIAVGLLGGSLADAVDRRKLVIVTSSGLALLSFVFALQAALNLHQLWLLYVVVAVQSCLFAIDQPARSTFIPRLLPSESHLGCHRADATVVPAEWHGRPSAGGHCDRRGRTQGRLLHRRCDVHHRPLHVVRLRPMPPRGTRRSARHRCSG